MSAYKQAGISLNRALAIAARTVRASLKPKEKLAAAARAGPELKLVRIVDGVQGEAKDLTV